MELDTNTEPGTNSKNLADAYEGLASRHRGVERDVLLGRSVHHLQTIQSKQTGLAAKAAEKKLVETLKQIKTPPMPHQVRNLALGGTAFINPEHAAAIPSDTSRVNNINNGDKGGATSHLGGYRLRMVPSHQGIRLPSIYPVTKVTTYVVSEGTYQLHTFKLEVSIDEVNWVQVGEVKGLKSKKLQTTIDGPVASFTWVPKTTTPIRSVRLLQDTWAGQGKIFEVEIFGVAD